MTINKEEFITRMAKKGGVTKCSCREYVDLMLATLFELLTEGINIRFVRYFKAEIAEAKEKEIYDISTKGRTILPAHKCIKIRVSKAIQEKFNNAYTESHVEDDEDDEF